MPYFSHEAHYWRLEGIIIGNMAVNLEITILEAAVTRTTDFKNIVIQIWRLVQNSDSRNRILPMRLFWLQSYSIHSLQLLFHSRVHHSEYV